MKVFIVYAHPSQNSFTYTILIEFIRGLTDARHEYQLSDLYDMGFCTDMNLSEYERESGLCNDRENPADISEEHKKLDWADVLVFIYPLWWSDCPAKLKGWFDRVYTVGYAYSHLPSTAIGLKPKRGVVICTAGHTVMHLEECGVAESIRRVMLYDRLQNVGIKDTELFIFGGTADKNNDTWKVRYTMAAYELGLKMGQPSR